MSETKGAGTSQEWLPAAPVALLAVPALIVFFSELFVSYGIYDEGLILYGAHRVETGALPYRDFWTLYAPGQFYLLAGLFRVFGTSIVVERVWSAIVLAGIVWAIGCLVRRSARPLFSMLAGVSAIAWLAETPMPGSPLPIAVCLSLCSLLTLERALLRRSQQALFGAACLAGIAALFRHDLGALLCIAQVTRLAFARCSPFPYLLGVLAPTLPVAALLIWVVPIETLLDSLVIFPLRVFPEVRGLPLPAFAASSLSFYLAPCLLGLATVRAAMRWYAGARLDGSWCSALLFGILLLQQAQVRSDANHMLPSTLLAIAVSCGMFEDLAAARRRFAAAALPAALATLVLGAGIGTALIQPVRTWLVARPLPLVESQLPRAAGIRIPPAKQRYETVVDFVRNRVPDSQKIFVGNSRHDTIAFNDAIFYFLSERESATGFHELHPGAATEEPVQKQIVQELAIVDTIVLASVLAEEENRSSESSGVRLLDDYIRQNFSVVHQASGYRVLQRR